MVGGLTEMTQDAPIISFEATAGVQEPAKTMEGRPSWNVYDGVHQTPWDENTLLAAGPPKTKFASHKNGNPTRRLAQAACKRHRA